MSTDNKIDITVRIPIVGRKYTLSSEAALAIAEHFKDQPITMGENVVGICRSGTFDASTNEVLVDAVIWATIGGISEASRSVSFEVAKG